MKSKQILIPVGVVPVHPLSLVARARGVAYTLRQGYSKCKRGRWFAEQPGAKESDISRHGCHFACRAGRHGMRHVRDVFGVTAAIAMG